MEYILTLMSRVERVRQTFTNCGTYAVVVRIAAMNPIASVNRFCIKNKKTID